MKIAARLLLLLLAAAIIVGCAGVAYSPLPAQLPAQVAPKLGVTQKATPRASATPERKEENILIISRIDVGLLMEAATAVLASGQPDYVINCDPVEGILLSGKRYKLYILRFLLTGSTLDSGNCRLLILRYHPTAKIAVVGNSLSRHAQDKLNADFNEMYNGRVVNTYPNPNQDQEPLVDLLRRLYEMK